MEKTLEKLNKVAERIAELRDDKTISADDACSIAVELAEVYEAVKGTA